MLLMSLETDGINLKSKGGEINEFWHMESFTHNKGGDSRCLRACFKSHLIRFRIK